jgi:hypothetical protein
LATYQAIAAVSAALRGLLTGAANPEIAGAEFQVVNGDTLQSPMADGVALFLCQVAVNNSARTGPPALAVDLHYLIAAWAADPIRQQVLLGWAAHVLQGTPVLNASMLNPQAPAPPVFRGEESVRLVATPIAMQDETAIWNAARALQQPSLHYVATGVRID